MDTNSRLNYGHEPDQYRNKALAELNKCKEIEASRKLVAVRIDKNTVKLMTPEKAEKHFKSLQK